MAEISAKDVMALRQKSGCGMMECKKALVASNGDVEGAMEYLRKAGAAKAAKKPVKKPAKSAKKPAKSAKKSAKA